MIWWATLDSRCRGLAARLLPPSTLVELRDADRLETVRAAVVSRGFPVSGGADAPALETAIRHGVAAELRLLTRWLEPAQRRALSPFFADDDRRSLRRLLRGLAAGQSPATRAAGTLPTPTLPVLALDELARQTKPASIAALLTVYGSPFGAALAQLGAAELGGGEPRLLRLELALDRGWAATVAVARDAAGVSLSYLYATWIDGLNAAAALLLAGGERELGAQECFLEGGRALGREEFLAAATGSPSAAAARLAPAFTGSTRRLLERGETGANRLDDALLADALAGQRRRARLEPLSSAPVALYFLGLRREAVALRRAAWRTTLGVREEAA